MGRGLVVIMQPICFSLLLATHQLIEKYENTNFAFDSPNLYVTFCWQFIADFTVTATDETGNLSSTVETRLAIAYLLWLTTK